MPGIDLPQKYLTCDLTYIGKDCTTLDKYNKSCSGYPLTHTALFLCRLSLIKCIFFEILWLLLKCNVSATATQSSGSSLRLTPLSTTFCHVGHILAVDPSRPVPQAPPCPVDEVDNSHSFRPRAKTEVSHLDVCFLI